MDLKNKAYWTLLLQLMRFGVVGLSAALVHFSIVVALVEWQNLQPMLANVVAFCVAFQVSYWGHRYWTFSNTQQRHTVAFPRLLLVSGATFLANESLFYIFMTQFHLPYIPALIFVLSVLPLAVFTMNKFWVFE